MLYRLVYIVAEICPLRDMGTNAELIDIIIARGLEKCSH